MLHLVHFIISMKLDYNSNQSAILYSLYQFRIEEWNRRLALQNWADVIYLNCFHLYHKLLNRPLALIFCRQDPRRIYKDKNRYVERLIWTYFYDFSNNFTALSRTGKILFIVICTQTERFYILITIKLLICVCQLQTFIIELGVAKTFT